MIPQGVPQDVLEKTYRTYEFMKSMYDFPHFYCTMAAKALEYKGIPHRRGWFLMDHPVPDTQERKGWKYVRAHHHWSSWGGGDEPGSVPDFIIDITAYQFNDGLDEKLPEEPLIITPEDPTFQRYVENVLQSSC